MTDCNWELSRANPERKITPTHPSTIFLYNLILPYGIPDYAMANIGPRFVDNVFTTLCIFLEAKDQQRSPSIP